MNFSIDHESVPLTDEQIQIIIDHTRFDAKTDKVRYRLFLDSFQVFDTVSAPQ